MEPANTYSEERLLYLLKGHISGNLTAPEVAELQQWQQASKENQQLLNDISNDEFRIQELKRQQVYNVESALIRVKKLAASKGALPLWPKLVAAASILFIIGLLFKVYVHQDNVNVIGTKTAANINQGSKTATLTLANGKVITLSDAANGQLAKEAGVEITKTADGQLIYEVSSSTSPTSLAPSGHPVSLAPSGRGGEAGEGGSNSNNSSLPSGISPQRGERGVALNTIETPRGGQYQVRLPDGSEVWLNAGSKLILPVPLMVRGKREVTLIGEAYFEIAKDKAHPFIVKSARQSVEVLGTHFNINAYSDEPNIKTTLLEGSVKISTMRSMNPASLSLQGRGGKAGEGEETILKPGQQATLLASKIQIENVDTEEAIAWKNGYFNLNNETTEGIMRQLSKWYDIEVAYKGNLPVRKFEGEIPRNNSLSETLKILKTANIHFIVEGKKITVIP